MYRKQPVHDMAFTGGDGPRLHHLGFFAPEPHSVLRICDILGSLSLEHHIERGPGRHGVSNAFYVYLRDPDGHRLESYTSDYYTATRTTRCCAGRSATRGGATSGQRGHPVLVLRGVAGARPGRQGQAGHRNRRDGRGNGRRRRVHRPGGPSRVCALRSTRSIPTRVECPSQAMPEAIGRVRPVRTRVSAGWPVQRTPALSPTTSVSRSRRPEWSATTSGRLRRSVHAQQCAM